MPLNTQDPLNPFVNDKVDTAGIASQATVIAAGTDCIVGTGAGLTVIVLVATAIGLPQASLPALQVSVIVPPQAPG